MAHSNGSSPPRLTEAQASVHRERGRGVELVSIMRQPGHASTSVALGYIRPAERARNPATRAAVESLYPSESMRRT